MAATDDWHILLQAELQLLHAEVLCF